MRINSIKLDNFRQYKNVELNFSFDPKKNVTIILGDNGYGKTTLVRSFLWCLYRDNTFQDKMLLNKDVANNMTKNDEKTVKVAIEIEHENNTYTITTQESYKRLFESDFVPVTNDEGDVVLAVSKKASTFIVKTGGSQSIAVPSSETKNVIERILRKELASFLFYDGENNKIENSAQSKNVTKAVYEFMGIQKIINLQTQLDPYTNNTVISRLRDSLKSSDEVQINALRTKKKEIEEKKQNKSNIIQDNVNEIFNLEEQYAEKEAILDANKDIKSDQDEKKRLDKFITDNQMEVDKSFQSVININNGESDSMLKSLFAYCYDSNNCSDLQQKTSFTSDASLSHISEEVVDEIIRRGYCLCGTKINDESDALKHLQESKNHMEPHDFGKYLSDFCSSEETNKDLVKSSTKDILKIGDNFLELIENIENSLERSKVLREKIEGRPDVGIIQRQADACRDNINRLLATNEYIKNNDLPELNKSIDELDKEIEKVSDDNDENTLTNRCIQYAQAIYMRTNLKIENAKKELKESLEKNTNEIFSSMYHGDRQIKLDDKFNVKTLINNQSIDNSTGIETVKNFAFVTALMKTLKEKVFNISDDEQKTNESYPLVIDAPFSNTDPTHIKNICAALPEHCNQLIIVVMKKDYDIAKKELESCIDKTYHICKHSETYDSIEEVKNV